MRPRRAVRPRLELFEHRLTPTALHVANTFDSGAGSLRAAITQADADSFNGVSDTIDFSGLTLPATITLTSGPLVVRPTNLPSGPTGSIEIDGGGQITVKTNSLTHVFDITGNSSGSPVFVAKINGLTVGPGAIGVNAQLNADVVLNNDVFTGCDTGVVDFDANVALNNSVVSGCNLYGVAMQPGPVGYSMTINHCVITGNAGGGVGAGTVTTILNSSIVNNQGDGGIAGLRNDFATLIVVNSTISGNTAQAGGVGVDATGVGGGIAHDGNLYLINSTVTDNTAHQGGGIGAATKLPPTPGLMLMVNSIVAGNHVVPDGSGNPGLDPDIAAFGGQSFAFNSIIADPAGLEGTDIANGKQHTIVGHDPLLGPPVTVGSLGPMFPLLPGSFAFKAGRSIGTVGATISDQPSATTITTRELGIPTTFSANGGEGLLIKVDNEDMMLTAIQSINNTSRDTLTVQRGVNGTQIAKHKGGTPILLATDEGGFERPPLPLLADIGAVQTTPTIKVSTNNLNLGPNLAGVPGTPQSFTVNGAFLSAPIKMHAPPGVELSSGGHFAASLTLKPDKHGTVPDTVINVRTSKRAAAAAINGQITVQCVGAVEQDVALTGKVESLTIHPNSLSLGSTVTGTAGSLKTYTISGTNLGATVAITAPAGVELSVNGGQFVGSLSLPTSAGNLADTIITVRIAASAAVGKVGGEKITNVVDGLEKDVIVSGTVKAAAALPFGIASMPSILTELSGLDLSDQPGDRFGKRMSPVDP